MKSLVFLLLLPCYLFSAHSFDVGTFYSVFSQEEKMYNLVGLSASYEVGNSKRLKATGKTCVSYQSNLFYIKSYNDLRWMMHVEEYVVSPFIGMQWTHHEAFREEDKLVAVKRTAVPMGVILSTQKEGIIYSFHLGHIHSVREVYSEEINSRKFYGELDDLINRYLWKVEASYPYKEGMVIKGSFAWEGYYANLGGEATLGVTFSYPF